MKTYTVKITETNVCFVQVEAPDKESAKDIVREMYDTCEDYLDEHISMDEGGVEFEVTE